jgi:hypothetical protein
MHLGYKVDVLADLDTATHSRFREDFPSVEIIGEEFTESGIKQKSFYSSARDLFAKIIFSSSVTGQFKLSWNPLINHLNKDQDKYSLVINMYLDPMSEDMQELCQLSKFDIHWIGLLFHPKQKTFANSFLEERYFALPNNLGALFFTQETVNFYNRISPKFRLAPDVATSEFSKDQKPSEDEEFQTIIECFEGTKNSANVKTIAMVGSIGPSKMIFEFVEFALACKSLRYRFAIIGEVHLGNLGSEDKRALKRFEKNAGPRYVFANHYIQRDKDYNNLFSKMDFIFAGYRDWNSSNNFLAKASILKKPILTVPDGSLAVAVGMNGIGLISESTQPESLINCLEKLDTYNELKMFERNFDKYSEKNGENYLAKVLSNFLDQILEDN